jgi:hypothetical protein
LTATGAAGAGALTNVGVKVGIGVRVGMGGSAFGPHATNVQTRSNKIDQAVDRIFIVFNIVLNRQSKSFLFSNYSARNRVFHLHDHVV